MQFKKLQLDKILIFIFFFLVYFIGINLFRDYNVYSDETFHRWAGNLYYLFIKDFFINYSLENKIGLTIIDFSQKEGFKDWFIGPIFFDLITESLIDLLNLSEPKSIYQLRHLINYSIFFISGIFFYFLLVKRFQNKFFSIITIIYYYYSPRIFAEAFYNTKDILFLSFVTISIFFAHNYLKNNSLKNLIIFSIFAGITANVRILGIFLPILLFFIIFFEDTQNKFDFFKNFTKFIISLTIVFILNFVFWPFLWFSPLDNLLYYLNFLSSINSGYLIDNIFSDKIISSINIPWYYLITWISITLPISLVLFSFASIIYTFKFFFNRLLNFDEKNSFCNSLNEKIDFFIFIFFFSFLILTISTSDFNGWRHFYFLFFALIYFLAYFLNFIKKFKYVTFLKIVYFIIFFDLLYNLHWMVKNHSFQYVYFNQIKSKILRTNFDLDYWGLSEKNALEYILKNDLRDQININSISDHSWIQGSVLMLDKKNQKRIKLVNNSDADYLIDRSILSKKENLALSSYIIYYEVIVDNLPIIRVYKK